MTPVRLAWTGLAVGVTAVWVAFALGGGDGAPIDTTAAGAAAGAGMAALLGAGWRPVVLGGVQAGGVALVVLPAAVAAPAGGSTALLVAGLGLAAGAEVAVRWSGAGAPAVGPRRHLARRRGIRLGAALPVVAGCGVLAGGLLVERADAGSWVLPTGNGLTTALVLAGAGVLLLVAALGPSRAWALAVPALVVALPVASHLPPDAGVAAAAAAAVFAAAILPARPSVALAALAVAAAISAAPTGPVAALLAAGAALGLAVEHPAAALLGLPAASALAALAVPSGRSEEVALLAGTAVVTAACLAVQAGRAGTPQPWAPSFEAAPALGLAGWLALAPETWAWTGAGGTGAYDRGAAVAAAATALTLAAIWARPFLVAIQAARAEGRRAAAGAERTSPPADESTREEPAPEPAQRPPAVPESTTTEPTPPRTDEPTPPPLEPPPPDGPTVVPIPPRRPF